MANIQELVGKKLTEIKESSNELIFITDDGVEYKMFHIQDCCESVSIDDINGDLSDLIGSPILLAEKVSNFIPENETEITQTKEAGEWESCTWTFYKISTVKGYVNIRWFGESNGYYSEDVDFIEIGVDEEW